MEMRSFGEQLLDFFFPRTRCMVCDAAQAVEEGLCADCRLSMERDVQDGVCAVCGKPIGDSALCLRCRVQPPPYAAMRAVYLYQGATRALLHRMKFGGEFELPVRLFSREMARLTRQLGWKPDCVVCVPSALDTLCRRGYNQAEVLAKRTASRLHLPYVPRALKKRRGTRSQVGLGAQARRSNLLDSILPGKGMEQLRGRNVLLIDDTYTTGATAEICADALRTGGAKAVYVLCAARVPDAALAAHLAGRDEAQIG